MTKGTIRCGGSPRKKHSMRRRARRCEQRAQRNMGKKDVPTVEVEAGFCLRGTHSWGSHAPDIGGRKG